ncbi:MAG: hypothetical protein IJ169_04460 [Paludibacteraceae bacterium]|nr:hypothetical protein [Paludibacteraceae bacterium]
MLNSDRAMYFISINIHPYLAQYARVRFAQVDGAVLLPRDSIIHYALINRLQAPPKFAAATQPGNLAVAVRETETEKDVRRLNGLSDSANRHIEQLLRLDFDMTLHEYMDRAYYKQGTDYLQAAALFHQHYRLGSTITQEALLKKHVRWKKRRRDYRKNSEQLELTYSTNN